MLLQNKWPFAKAWQHVLQYACLTRTKGATANRYSQLKKDTYTWERIGRGMSADKRVIQAKTMAKLAMKTYLKEGVPVMGPQPKTMAERERDGDLSDY